MAPNALAHRQAHDANGRGRLVARLRAVAYATGLALIVYASLASPPTQATSIAAGSLGVLSAPWRAIPPVPAIHNIAKAYATEPAMKEKIALTITGSAGAEFAADCQLKTDGKEIPLEFKGTVPYSAEIAASGIRCKITSHDMLTVEARTGRGNVTRSSSSGGTINISLN